jgi:hypothetical protein
LVLLSAALLGAKPSEAGPVTFEVLADRFFNFSGLEATGNERFSVVASGVVDISTLNGGYRTDPDGVLVETPPPESGSLEFFRDRALPFGVDPVAGASKGFDPLAPSLPGHAPGEPYGALVAGFSPTATPSSFADFPFGFQLVGSSGTIAAPVGGGFLFFGVNDFNNPGGDNAGSFSVTVEPAPISEPASIALVGIGLAGAGAALRRRGVQGEKRP